MKRTYLLIFLIFALALILRIYRLNELMPFIGDQGWFYLSARDMLLKGKIPLVGIASSHTWLHQGALWTYILAALFFISNFNPLAPGYFSAFLGAFTVSIYFLVTNQTFGKKVAVVSAILFAASPLAIIHSRLPYHTVPIPFLVVLLFFFIFKWLQGEKIFFPLSILMLSLLYNFELASQTLWFIIVGLLVWGISRRKKWARFDVQTIFYSILAVFVPFIPILLYDFQHGFPQTLKFAGWAIYSGSRIFLSQHSFTSYAELFRFFQAYNARIIFLPSKEIAILITGGSLIFGVLYFWKRFRKKTVRIEYVLLFLFILIPLAGYLATKAPSEAYLPLLYPQLFILVSLFLNFLFRNTLILTSMVLVIAAFNTHYLVSHQYLMGKYSGYGPTFGKRVEAAKRITKEANGKDYELIGKGGGSEFESFTMSYEYLTWFYRNGPKSKKVSINKFESSQASLLKFVIEEKNGEIILTKIIK